MKAVVKRKSFLDCVQIAKEAVPSREIKQVLKHLRVVFGPVSTVEATDLEVGVRVDLPDVQVQEAGEVLLPAQRLEQILKELGDDELSFCEEPTEVVVQSVSSEFALPHEDPAHFPAVPDWKGGACHSVASPVLREMIKRTVFATANESARYSMQGVAHVLEGGLRLVATDGRRLATVTGACEVAEKPAGFDLPVVPTKALDLVGKLIKTSEDAVQFRFSPNEVLYRTERGVVYSRLIEGRFPEWTQVVPKDIKHQAGFRAGAMVSALRQAAIMTDDESKRVNFTLSSGKVRLQAQGTHSGRSRVETDLDYDGPGVETAFNPVFILEGLSRLPPEAEVLWELSAGDRPSMFKHGEYLYLVMPLTNG